MEGVLASPKNVVYNNGTVSAFIIEKAIQELLYQILIDGDMCWI
jgi:hypothetical protein